jgi:hypothetical protein
MFARRFVKWNPFLPLTPQQFAILWRQWMAVHGPPPKVLDSLPGAQRRPDLSEIDLSSHTVERLVVCERPDTVELFLANGFHIEHRSPVVSADGYPGSAFPTAMDLARRSRRLVVAVVHDASPQGCALAHRLATDNDWFAEQVTRRTAVVVDAGLRPRQCRPYRGCFEATTAARWPHPLLHLDRKERRWLARYRLDLTAVRPEQLLRGTLRVIEQGLPVEDRRSEPSTGPDELAPAIGWFVADLGFDAATDAVFSDADEFG